MKTRKNGTVRVHPKLDSKKLTDQSYKQSTCINHIMSQYVKTGVLPSGKNGIYADFSELPDFMTAHRIVEQAKNMFQELPSVVRKAMDNDPSQLERFINDPRNQNFLVEHGVLQRQAKKAPEPISEASESASSSGSETTEEKEVK